MKCKENFGIHYFELFALKDACYLIVSLKCAYEDGVIEYRKFSYIKEQGTAYI